VRANFSGVSAKPGAVIQQRDHRQHQGQQATDVGQKGAGGLLALLGLVLGEDGDERLGKSPFGEDAAQQVGQLEGDEKGVGGHAGAKGAGDDGVAHETQHAGQHGHGADGGQGLEQIHGRERTR